MDADQQLAPPVVSVMVVHEPGDWFEATLRALADQDYRNLRHLFLVTGDLAALTERITAVIPEAFVREVAGNPGFGPAVGEVLRLVDGDNGFFLVCHDDIVPARTTVRLLVAELFRSNAGIVGPKLVDWDEPRRLQHVGLGLDRFGEVDPVVDAGEFDQEQHDAVRDVFAVPSACLLVRADLFRLLGGFDPAIDYHGEDLDLCWRAHLTGARVVVVPDAVVRHRERLTERRPDLHHRMLVSRHRLRLVATLTGRSRLAARLVQLTLLTIVELVVGLFTGRFGEAVASLRALVGLVPRAPGILARRRAVRRHRAVHEREVLAIQVRGSARLQSYLRGKDTLTYVGADTTVRRWREASFGPLLAWFLVVLAVVVGSRSFVRDGVPPVGEFLPFPDSPSDLWADYRSSFDGRGVGATSAVPTGWALVALAGLVVFARMDLLMTLSVVGLHLLGALGVWRLATVFPLNRARIAALVVYVGSPLVPGLLGDGDWSALAWFAALPWMVHLARRLAGIDTADPLAASGPGGEGLLDGLAPVGVRHRVRAFGYLTLVTASVAAFVPVTVVLWPVVALGLALGTVTAAASWRTALWFVVAGIGSSAAAWVLNLPWSLDWDGDVLVGARPAGASGRPLTEVLSLSPDGAGFSVLALALLLPLVGGVAITRAWRFTWTVRAVVVVVVFGAVLVASEAGLVDGGGVALPRPSLLAVPVAFGLAVGAAAVVEGFGSDVLGRGFGWRQPVAVLANLAIVVGIVPAALAVGGGSWGTPGTPLPSLLATQFPTGLPAGDYRILYVGDPRIVPVPATEYSPGIAYAVTDAGPLTFTDRFPRPAGEADDAVVRALDLVASGSTLRVGRLLAPLGIRYVVVPETDEVLSTDEAPLPVAEGLVPALQNQLDIGTVYGLPSLQIFENLSWVPVGAALTGPTAEASRTAGDEVLVRADLGSAVPALAGVDRGDPAGESAVGPGVLHVGIPYDRRIELTVDGTPVPSRPGFGLTTAFDIDGGGVAVLDYRDESSRRWWIAGQVVLWVAALLVAAGARSPLGRRSGPTEHDETLIVLGAEPLRAVPAEALLADPLLVDPLLVDPGPVDDEVDLDALVAEFGDDAPEASEGGPT